MPLREKETGFLNLASHKTSSHQFNIRMQHDNITGGITYKHANEESYFNYFSAYCRMYYLKINLG